jgi:hypothetical protein
MLVQLLLLMFAYLFTSGVSLFAKLPMKKTHFRNSDTSYFFKLDTLLFNGRLKVVRCLYCGSHENYNSSLEIRSKTSSSAVINRFA